MEQHVDPLRGETEGQPDKSQPELEEEDGVLDLDSWTLPPPAAAGIGATGARGGAALVVVAPAAPSGTSSSTGFKVPALPTTASTDSTFLGPTSQQRVSGSPALRVPAASTAPALVRPSSRGLKVGLAPGHSPLDWARLSATLHQRGELHQRLGGGGFGPPRITPAQVAQHARREDVWMSLQGKVYNITPYLPFHPGGIPELMRAAGRDGTALFTKVHPWVNVENLLAACFLGYLVHE